MSLLLGKEFFPDLLSIESHFYQFNFIRNIFLSCPQILTRKPILPTRLVWWLMEIAIRNEFGFA